MAINNSSITNMKALIEKRGMAKSNRFEVDFSGLINLGIGADNASCKDLSMCVDTVSMPGRTIETFAYSLYRQPIQVPTGYTNEPFSVEFLTTGDMFCKKIFDKWIDKVVPTESYLMQYFDSYKTTLRISQLDIDDSVKYTLVLNEAFPTAIRALSYNSNTDDIVRFGVEFAYTDIVFP